MTSTIITAIASVLVALVTSQQVTGMRARRQQRTLATRLDALETRIYEVRRAIRAHNENFHPDGEGAYPLPELPDWMASTADPE